MSPQSFVCSRALRGSCLDLSFGLGDAGSLSMTGAHGIALQMYEGVRHKKAQQRRGGSANKISLLA